MISTLYLINNDFNIIYMTTRHEITGYPYTLPLSLYYHPPYTRIAPHPTSVLHPTLHPYCTPPLHPYRTPPYIRIVPHPTSVLHPPPTSVSHPTLHPYRTPPYIRIVPHPTSVLHPTLHPYRPP